MDFYNEINAAVHEEAADNNKYIKLAEIAPTEKAKKILMDISREEERHKEFLQEILADGKSEASREDHSAEQNEESSEYNAGS